MKTTTLSLFHTLRFKMIAGILLLTLPLIGLLLYNGFYAIDVVRNQVTQSNRSMTTLYMGQIDNILGDATDYLYQMAAEETELITFEQSAERNENRYNEARIFIYNLISNDILNYKAIDAFFAYSKINDDLLMTQSLTNTYEQQQLMRERFTDLLREDSGRSHEHSTEWTSLIINHEYYLYRTVRAGEVILGAWVKADKLMVPLEQIRLGKQGRALLAAADGQPMKDADFVRSNGIDLSEDRLSGGPKKFLVIRAPSQQGSFSLVAIVSDEAILENLPYLQYVATLILIGSIILLPAFVWIFRKMLLVPIQRTLVAMKRIREGKWETRIEPLPSSLEFEIMHETFNRMITTVQELKISVYEEQLNNQRAELRQLQLLINPHFFLNSLNIIYNSSQSGNNGIVREMTHSLVQYFRYMFRGDKSFVSLREEIEHTYNYLRIQELRFPDQLTYELAAPDALMYFEVPPLLIQSFVENTIKHAVTMDEPIHISIVVEADENPHPGDSQKHPEFKTEFIRIHIYDTGKGFPDAILDKLNAPPDPRADDGEHFGIWNVKRRLRLLYTYGAGLTLSNGTEWGADICIVLPRPHHTGGGSVHVPITDRG